MPTKYTLITHHVPVGPIHKINLRYPTSSLPAGDYVKDWVVRRTGSKQNKDIFYAYKASTLEYLLYI